MALFGNKKKLTQQEVEALSKAMYVGATPIVDRAYKTDPRSGIANALMGEGTRTDPLAGGMTEGIARALSGVAGGYIGKQQRDKYNAVDQAAQTELTGARRPVVEAELGIPAGGMDPNIASLGDPNSALGQVASAMGPQQPVQQGAPQAPALAPNFTQRGPASVGPAPTVTTPSPQLTPTPRSVASPAAPRVLRPGESARAPDTGFGSYKSGAYEPIEAAMEQKHGLPPGTLKGLRMAERSNADQVSPTGARSVYQFVPGTRNRFKRKYGVDAWAGPEQSVEAAALHIKDSLARGRSMEQALRDYRGVDESADPGWYARARGGGDIPGGSQPSSPSPAQVAVPDMPEAPVAPKRPELPERVRSARLQVAYNLMNSGSGLNSAILGSLIDPEYQEGMTETQKSKEAEYEAQTQLINNEFTSKLQGYNQKDYALFKQPLEERTAAIQQRDTLQRDEIQDQYQTKRDQAERTFRADENVKDREAEDKRYKDRASNSPVFAEKEFYENTNLVKDAGNIFTLLEQRPESVGAQFAVGDVVSQRGDKEGEGVRAAISNYAGLILHGVSGAAVTPEEWQRNRSWLPTVNDTPEAIRVKVKNIQERAQSKIGTLQGMYGATGPLSGGMVPAGGGLPAGVTVEEVK